MHVSSSRRGVRLCVLLVRNRGCANCRSVCVKGKTSLIRDYSWRIDAECQNYPTEMFFGEVYGWDAPMVIKATCNRCPVRQECLDAALWEEQDTPTTRFGIRGGMTWKQRANFWRALINRRAGWCQMNMHIVEADETECQQCIQEQRKTA